jgi:hypothetical protein
MSHHAERGECSAEAVAGGRVPPRIRKFVVCTTTCLQARSNGALPEEALAQLQSVEATGVLETMAAMDAINGLEPLAAVTTADAEGALGCALHSLCTKLDVLCMHKRGGWLLRCGHLSALC